MPADIWSSFFNLEYYERYLAGPIINFTKVLYKLRILSVLEDWALEVKLCLLLGLSIIVSTVVALEPQEIGRGRSDEVMNLDVGPNNPGTKLHFGTHGFAAPAIPQFAEVSPGAMVHQSKMYRDESRILCINARSILNQTSALENSTTNSADRATVSSAMAQMSANSSMSNVMLSKTDLVQTESALNKTLSMSNRTEMLA
jgi:hypothetical protein